MKSGAISTLPFSPLDLPQPNQLSAQIKITGLSSLDLHVDFVGSG